MANSRREAVIKEDGCEFYTSHSYKYSEHSPEKDGNNFFINLFGGRYMRIGIDEPFMVTQDDRNRINTEQITINFCPFCGKDVR